MERLITKVDNEYRFNDVSVESLKKVANRLGELEDKIENGSLVELPDRAEEFYTEEHNEFNTKLGKGVAIITFSTTSKTRFNFIQKMCRAMVDKKDVNNFIELPCKVGDVIYKPKRPMLMDVYSKSINFGEWELSEYDVVQIEIDSNSVLFIGDGGFFDLDEHNKTWFTDKAKAEEKLKELNNG